MDRLNPRYARHYTLAGFGEEAQEKLAKSKVLVIGAGGLGCPALQYLAAAGVGTIGIADADTVSLSNLQRQVVYGTDDVGKPKAEIAARKLMQLNNEITVLSYCIAIANHNALDIISDYDVVLDCTDNFASRYTINDACVLLSKPLVFGAVYLYEGQVAVFNALGTGGQRTNYRHLFPQPPDASEVANCSEVGVLGVLPGIIGTMQATEGIKLLTGIGEVLINKLLTINLLTWDTYIIEIQHKDYIDREIPTTREEYEATDYEWFCGSTISGITQLDNEAFLKNISSPDTLVVDVREAGELPVARFPNKNIPLSLLAATIPEIYEGNIILFCQSGKRSSKAAELLLDHYSSTKKISQLKGGILSLNETTYE